MAKAAEDQPFWDELEFRLRQHYDLDVEDEFWEADWFELAIIVARDLGHQQAQYEGKEHLARAEVAMREYYEKRAERERGG